VRRHAVASLALLAWTVLFVIGAVFAALFDSWFGVVLALAGAVVTLGASFLGGTAYEEGFEEGVWATLESAELGRRAGLTLDAWVLSMTAPGKIPRP
jgi:hypothetical protein